MKLKHFLRSSRRTKAVQTQVVDSKPPTDTTILESLEMTKGHKSARGGITLNPPSEQPKKRVGLLRGTWIRA